MQSTAMRTYNLRITVMSIDVHFSNTSSRRITASGTGIVANHGHDNARGPCLVDHILHVLRIREFRAAASTTVLIFRLIQDNRAAIGYLSLGNRGCDIGNVTGQWLLDSNCVNVYQGQGSHTYQWPPSSPEQTFEERLVPFAAIPGSHRLTPRR